MLMPTKHINTENALIGVGAEILTLMDTGKTASRLFHDLQFARKSKDLTTIHFDWFLLAVDFLYTVGAVRLEGGILKKANQ